MAEFYASMIQNKVINTKTGAPWEFHDVPNFWKHSVKGLL